MMWKFGRGMLSILGVLTLAGAASAQAPKPASDEEVKAKIAAAGAAEDYDDADRVIVLDESDCTVGDNGVATTVQRRVIKLLAEAGVKAESSQRFEFDPNTTRSEVLRVLIHRQEGTDEEVPLEGMVQRPAPAHWIYWGNQLKVLSLPHLKVGDTIDLTTSKRGFNIAYLSPDSPGQSREETELIPPMPGHWYETVYFQDHLPVIEQRYTVRLPKDKPLQYEVYHGTVRSSLLFDGDYHVYTFEARDIPAFKSEPRMIAFSDAATKLVLATLENWEAKSRWFYEANEGQFEADDAIRAKVAELTQGLTTDEEKISALLHWAADKVRYIGTSRGPTEGYTLHKGTETFRDRGGVCKDKAGMGITLLRAAGFETYPVLTQAGSDVEIIPADQFNHTVACIRNQDGSLTLIDPTWVPLSREWWSTREPRQAVVYGLPEGKGLCHSPYYSPEENLVHATAEGEIGPDGTLNSRIRWHDMVGYPCTYQRRYINRYSLRDLRGFFEEQIARIGPTARLGRLRYSDPYDYSKSAELELTVSASHYALGDGETRIFRLPLMQHPVASIFLPDLLYELPETRKYGVRLRATRLAKYEETLHLPPGWTVEHVPANKDIDNEAAELHFEAETAPDYIRYRFSIALREQIVDPDKYAGHKEIIQAMNQIAEEWIVCRTGDVHAVAAQSNHETDEVATDVIQ